MRGRKKSQSICFKNREDFEREKKGGTKKTPFLLRKEGKGGNKFHFPFGTGTIGRENKKGKKSTSP